MKKTYETPLTELIVLSGNYGIMEDEKSLPGILGAGDMDAKGTSFDWDDAGGDSSDLWDDEPEADY